MEDVEERTYGLSKIQIQQWLMHLKDILKRKADGIFKTVPS
jgi:hypothetical protein